MGGDDNGIGGGGRNRDRFINRCRRGGLSGDGLRGVVFSGVGLSGVVFSGGLSSGTGYRFLNRCRRGGLSGDGLSGVLFSGVGLSGGLLLRTQVRLPGFLAMPITPAGGGFASYAFGVCVHHGLAVHVPVWARTPSLD